MKSRTGIVADLFFGQDTAFDLIVDRSQGFETPEHLV